MLSAILHNKVYLYFVVALKKVPIGSFLGVSDQGVGQLMCYHSFLVEWKVHTVVAYHPAG